MFIDIEKSDVLRVFIAINFDNEIKDYIYKYQNIIKTGTKRGNFTNYENFHITLQFLGDVEKSDIDNICDAIYNSAIRNKQFNLNINNVGTFDKNGSSILWLGIEKNNNIDKLYNTISKFLLKEGFSTKKRLLKPHITIAREVEFYSNIKNINFKFPIENKSFIVNKITLMQSIRNDYKLIYKPLYQAELKK